MPEALTDKPKTVVDTAAASGWLGMGEQTQKACDQFFKLCNMLIQKDGSLVKPVDTAPQSGTKRNSATTKGQRPASQKKAKAPAAKPDKLQMKIPDNLPKPKEVPVIASQTGFIKRYLAMHGKIKTRDQILSLLHGLQKAITEQRITQTSPAVREIQKMQTELVELVRKMDDRAKIEIAEHYLAHYRQIVQGEEVRTSVRLLKQFIRMSGTSADKEKAEKLGKKMAAAVDTIPKEDIYRSELSAGAKAIAAYVSGNAKTVNIPEASVHGLSGLAGIGRASGLGRAGGNVVVGLLQESGVGKLTDASMRRAFAKAPAPEMCLELARLMIRKGELNSDLGKSVHITRSSKQRTELAGMDLESNVVSSSIGETELLDMRLGRHGRAAIAGLGSISSHDAPAAPRHLSTAVEVPQNEGMEKVSARDLAKLRFKTIGYNGRFKDVIGDPAVGFHMMVYGKPFQGKSSFVIELCKDLAALKKGRIAYLALEEGISASMQKKLIDRGAANVDGLDFLGSMPESFNGYSFIVIDSVSDRSMKRERLRELFLQNPQTSFICIFHATKEGTARGGLDYSHDMDIILKIDQHQPTVEKNRFI